MAAADGIKIFRAGQEPPPGVTEVGHVMGYSCKSVTTDPSVTLTEATAEARFKAMISGANAITGFSCKLAGTNATCADCWNCTECTGVAVSQPHLQ
jgi:hypothetical protein